MEADPPQVASRSSTDPGSSSSIASNGGGGGGGGSIRTRHSSGVSQRTSDAEMDAVDAYELTGCMSLLVRPKLVWKAERQQQRGGDLLGELWNPCGAAFMPGDERLVVAEYDMAAARNNKICIFDATGTPYPNDCVTTTTASGCVVECRICNRGGGVAGSNLGLGYFAPRSTQPSIPAGSVNEYQL